MWKLFAAAPQAADWIQRPDSRRQAALPLDLGARKPRSTASPEPPRCPRRAFFSTTLSAGKPRPGRGASSRHQGRAPRPPNPGRALERVPAPGRASPAPASQLFAAHGCGAAFHDRIAQALNSSLFQNPQAKASRDQALLLLLCLALLARLPIWLGSYGAAFDLESYRRVAEALSQGRPLYGDPALDGRYPYLPAWALVLCGLRFFSTLSGLAPELLLRSFRPCWATWASRRFYFSSWSA